MQKYVALSVQPLWDKYQFEKNIDSGAFGSVKKVKNTQDGKFYAMKTQNIKTLMTRVPNNYSNEMVRIIREINTFRLSHPNITEFKESYFTYDDEFVIITELAESNLQVFRENTELTNDQIAGIMMQIIKGTIHLHNQNVMHRDLSPDNILVFENGQKFKICDFGMAQLLSNSNSYVGKLFFKAPEIDQNEEFSYSTQVDIWSLGVILYYLCTKKYQYQGEAIAKIKKKDQSKFIQLEGKQKKFEPLLNKMLQFNPALRIDAVQVLLELCKLNNEPFSKHLETEEVKQNHLIPSNNAAKNAFALTISGTNDLVNEIISKLGEFNYGVFDKIHRNPDRIFMPLIKYDFVMYQGEYDQFTNQKDGRGRAIHRDGTVYDGLWKNDLRNGYGRVIKSNGDYYIGEWKDGKKNGIGKYYFNDGMIYQGKWTQGNIQGLVLLNNSNGNYLGGQWLNGNKYGAQVFSNLALDIEVDQRMNDQQLGESMQISKDKGQIRIRKLRMGSQQRHKSKKLMFKNELS
ncbi:mitogen-activated protein kinase 16 [Stylonychia lemnae]|uniref:Mitogen-activated protein kinase 16 n=1 Tax=Stylonychia lemnae TaxID=5949 RepID=A0A078B1Z3_STYLE|nr:mitogen-activated protein kinase 16 [Stylonychia lemnae]|eukprot:CDW87368.1 mitogen-activated protein kinase 16 [Stylonychia lemnae]